MNEVRLGRIDSFLSFPAEVRIGRELYFLMRTESGCRLLSRNCPHAGGLIEYEAEARILFCPNHFWVFEASSGQCVSTRDHCLGMLPTTERDGVLYAVLHTPRPM
jgi:nitrite reductase/ring-hydroxylating ferredoxin subunit